MNKINIWRQGQSHLAAANPGETLYDVLSKQNIKIPAPCGGNGTCGKCVVNSSEGEILSCQTFAADVTDVYLDSPDEKALIVLDSYDSQRPFESNRTGSYGIAIDIGTTTIALEMVRQGTVPYPSQLGELGNYPLSHSRRIASYSIANSQRSFGADVVTRIRQATQGAQAQLHACISNDITQGIKSLLEKSGVPTNEITTVAIAGNTTMLHLLQNMPCDTLGVFPFTPVDINMRHCLFPEVFGDTLSSAELLILPGISTFVGADIAAGILCCQIPSDPNPNLIIDLGTNGEMALFSPNRTIVTSTAAGPAFEAANISCGTASIPGAIATVRYLPENNVFMYETIDNQPPIGICGTGVVDIAAELVRHSLTDETGRLEEPFFDKGVELTPGVIFTQKDMREIQLAKSAVRSGIEILLDVAGYGYNDIGKVYLAGGFGHRINMDSAVTLGLIPPKLAGKIVTVGNTSLGGAAHVLLSKKAETDIKALASQAEEVNLSTHPRFNDLFMEHMMFE